MTSLGQVQTQSIQQQQQQLSALANQPNAKTLFVGDLSAFCTEAQLYETFRRFGDIESIKLMRNKKNKPMGYGFVTYVDLDSCHRALVMDGNLFLGRPIRLVL
jgi:RNA recognition motif-containing protein